MVMETTNKNQFGDIDLDFKDRSEILDIIKHIPASIIKDNQIEKHKTGIYVQDIPKDPITGFSSIDYEKAEELCYVKLDFLNLGAYKDITSNDHLNQLISKEPLWDLLDHQEVLDKLYQIHDHIDIVKKMRPRTIEQLAMTLAIIRPGKRHLIGKSWKHIEKEIWNKTDDGGYAFRKSHAHAYALMIVMQLNLIEEQLSM